ncbi:MAG: bifunctional phosphoribosylaminoimidazolecarboxamide formyltransferase/IMP cyclohydrolase [Candidatus Hydrogenedentota bacterium]
MKKRVLISVYKKDKILELAKTFVNAYFEIISSGGTYNYLVQNNIPAIPVEKITGFPEILNGRVKTLHPAIHGGLLGRDTDEDIKQLNQLNINFIDVCCVNLYPFEGIDKNSSIEELIEMIDIGGVALIRAAAKNYKRVAVIVDIDDYDLIINEIVSYKYIKPETRKYLALKAFKTTMNYDACIWKRLLERLDNKNSDFIVLEEGEKLRYGENPHQLALLYNMANDSYSLKNAEILHGREMSYNNYLDLYASIRPLFNINQAAVCVVKHTNPCGLATHRGLSKAFEYAWECDSKSAFGGIVAMNRKCTPDLATLTKNKFIEVIAAPDYDEKALSFLKEKSANLRVIKLDIDKLKNIKKEIHCFSGIALETLMDEIKDEDLKPVTDKKIDESLMELVRFGIISCANIKSNSVSLVCKTPDKEGMIQLGMGSGQPNRIDSLSRLAIPKALDNSKKFFNIDRLPDDTVLISEAFFPFEDIIEIANQYSIKYIVQPGGSKRDPEIIKKCNEFGIAMAFTGVRHFRHF